MKRIILSVLTIVSISTISYGFQIPYDRDNVKARDISVMGVYVATVGYSAAASSTIVVGSSIAVYGVLTSTANQGSSSDGLAFVELRSTNTQNTISELLVPAIALSSATMNTLVVYDPPIIAFDGLSITITTIAASAAVFYRHLATTTRDAVWIPRDNDGEKVTNMDFVGVAVASGTAPGGLIGGNGTDSMDGLSAVFFVAQRRGFLYGFAASTGSTANYAVFRDSSSVGGRGLLLPPVFYNAMTVQDRDSQSRARAFSFPWPIIFRNGLTVERPSAVDRFRVFTRPTERLR